MLGFRLNKLGAATRSGLDPRSLFSGGSVGFLGYPLVVYQDSATPPVTVATTVGDLIGTMVSQVTGNFTWRQATAGSKTTLGSIPRGGRRNRLNATAVLSTQSVTVPALQMTLSMTGTGTITLSGVSTAGPLVGTGASNVVSLTFTPTAGSLTCTVSGSCTLVQLETGAVRTNYQDVVNAYTITESGVPTLQMPYFGGDDFAELSVSGTGVSELNASADYFADTGHSWAVGLVYSTFTLAGQMLFGKGTIGTVAPLSIQLDSVAGDLRGRVRGGTSGLLSNSVNTCDGAFHTCLFVCDNGVVTSYFDNDAPLSVNVGVAVEETLNLLLGARNSAAPNSFYTGFMAATALFSFAPSASQIAQYRSWSKSYYGSP